MSTDQSIQSCDVLLNDGCQFNLTLGITALRQQFHGTADAGDRISHFVRDIRSKCFDRLDPVVQGLRSYRPVPRKARRFHPAET